MENKKTIISNYDFMAEVEDVFKGPVIVKGLFPDQTGKIERSPKKAEQERFAEIQSSYLSLKLILPIGTKLSNDVTILKGYQTPYGKAIFKDQMPDLYEELLDFAEDDTTYNAEKNQFIGEAKDFTINNVHIAKIRTVVPYWVMTTNKNGELVKTENKFGKPTESNHFTVIALDREDIQGLARKQLGVLYNQKQFVSTPPSEEDKPAKTIPETANTDTE